MARNRKAEAKDPVWDYVDCPKCKGTGREGGYKCTVCRGFGYTRKQK